MPQVQLPFENLARRDARQRQARRQQIYRAAPAVLRQVMEKSPFLLEYLSMIPIEKVGFPEYHSSPSRSLSDRQNPNVLYPVSQDFFAHIYSDPESDWNYYIPIEPILTKDIGPLMEKVERKLLDHVHKANVTASDEEKKEFLLRSIDSICESNGRPHGEACCRSGEGRTAN